MERVDGGRKMHLVVFDLRNSIAGDVRFRTVGSVSFSVSSSVSIDVGRYR